MDRPSISTNRHTAAPVSEFMRRACLSSIPPKETSMERCKVNMDGLSWSHTTSVRVDSTTLNGAVLLGDGYYLVDVSASTTVTYPGKSDTGEVSNDQSMKIIVKETADEIRAISLDKYA